MDTLIATESPTIRNKDGLMKNLQYEYDENGFINWRKLIKKEHLVVNRDNFLKKNLAVPETIDGLTDKDLLILLAGIKDLAHVRGYLSVEFKPVVVSESHIITTCMIRWIPNVETNYQEIVTSAIGSANHDNTTSFGQIYLAEMAENRAFVRAVRNCLRIHIVGKDEVEKRDVDSAESETSASKTTEKSTRKNTKLTSTLNNLLKEKRVKFEIIKNKLVDEGSTDAAQYTSVEDLTEPELINMIERLQKIKTPAA